MWSLLVVACLLVVGFLCLSPLSLLISVFSVPHSAFDTVFFLVFARPVLHCSQFL